ncbi:ATP-binding cassette sub-family C member 9-like [Oppia nitens]|uniref:ATP-binding cassette sub-family C member 9-like n=1 Tax=Oppia nitens TaxID=1686743 RepID=UPI0023DAB5AD|nr:ATP-binding cassette sub-family C member 9-like [Oppia nitens]
MRVYIYFILFIVYSLLVFIELAILFKPCFKRPEYVPTIELEDTVNIADITGHQTKQIKYLRNYSSIISKATFSWFLPILKIGYRRPLELDDLGQLPNRETSEYQFIRFIKSLPDRKNCSPSQLWLCYWKTYWSSLAVGALIKIGADLFGLFGPLSIDYILTYVNKTQSMIADNYPDIDHQPDYYCLKWSQFLTNGYIIALIVLLATLLQSTFSNNFNHLVNAEGIHLKTALNCLVYDKTLRMTVQSGIDIGSIVNHMSIDSYNMFMLLSMGHYLWAVPLKILLLLYLMYCQLGYSALIGAATIFVLAPLQYFISTNLSKIQEQEMDIADERIRKTTELFMGIKFLKLLGWESCFADAVNKIRNKELSVLKKDAIYVALNTFITQGSAIVVTLVTFAIYPYIEGKPLSASHVFTGLALFNQLTVPLYIIPVVIPIMISAVISTKRLANFLSIPEVDPSIPWRTKTTTLQRRTNDLINDEYYVKNETKSSFDGNAGQPIINSNTIITTNNNVNNDMPVIKPKTRVKKKSSSNSVGATDEVCCRIVNGCFTWSLDNNDDKNADIDCMCQQYVLNNINIAIPKDKLTLIVGPVGSGKSSLLAAITGEMIRISGEVNWCQLNTFIGYVGQNPWLINTSLQENITFGSPLLHKRYNKVLKACALETDIKILPNGDQTEIGERGINLSGGQKDRIGLARALYSYANTLILDDTLSALDPIVGNHIFEYAIKKLMLQQKRTVIMVTNKLEYIPKANHIIVLESGGTIKHSASYAEIERLDPSLTDYWTKARNKEEEMRRKVTIEECGTTKERKSLVRMLSSNKIGCRGSFQMPSAKPKKPKRRQVSFNRQLSHDPSGPLPCHDWTDNDDPTIVGSHIEESVVNRSSTPFRRMHSKDSMDSKSSYGNSSHLSTSAESGGYIWMRPQMNRLNSTTSRVSYTSIREVDEEEEEEEELDIGAEYERNDQKNDDSESDDEIKLNDDVFEELKRKHSNGRTSSVATMRLMSNEKRETGSISKKVYYSYFKKCSIWLSLTCLLLIISTQGFKVVSDFWLAQWSKSDVSLANDYSQLQYYIKGYALLSLITIVISLMANLLSQLTSLRAVRLLHSEMLDNIIRCPLRFFDVTPFGRIINRFSNDMNTIDKKLPITLPVLLRFVFLCVSAIIVDIIITPYFSIAIIPILILYYFVQHFFRFTSRELQRLDSITKSPIFSLYSQTIDGLATLRAFNEEISFTDKIYELLDINNICFLMVNAANCWLGIALDYLGGVILFCATIASIWTAIHLNMSPAYVGMAMTYTLLVPIYLNWVVRNVASVEMYMNSVERVTEFSQLETEDQLADPVLIQVSEEWPKRGEIKFIDVNLKYDSNVDTVIRGANFHIKAGEKVGICGRTGCGKSSLINALFRLNNITNGKILIDGIDIANDVTTSVLRSRLSVIPQDVVLFSGTIRENLDPNNQLTDQQIWTVLRQLNLNKSIESLDDVITEEGLNLSTGQRQLLCIARALLRESTILVMDESTSSLDEESEHLVLDLIRQTNKTVISIAHKLSTILDYDKIIVVDKGVISEIGSPKELINRKDSLFNTLLFKQFKAVILNGV